MLIIAKILANYCVNQNIGRVICSSDLKYVHIADINLKRVIIDNF